MANYAAAKAGIIAFTKTAALELSQYGITVNVVSPGFMDTERAKLIPMGRDEIIKQIPLRRFGNPEEIATVVAFLASPQGGYINGSVVEVNGGKADYHFL